jgi:virulence factor Mce-like protein
MSPFKVGVIALVLIAVVAYFGLTRSNPFAHPFELHAAFRDAGGLQPNAPVRISGVEVGKVSAVESIDGSGAARVSMKLDDDALPIHRDARLKVRPRILLEGNMFVDLAPGSPSARELHDGATVPIDQTAVAVSLPDILRVLDTDVGNDLQTLLHEYGSEALGQGGAEAFNSAIPYLEPAYRDTAITNDALLGADPTHDVPRVLGGQASTFRALASHPGALEELVGDLNATAGALAREDEPLAASIPALRDTLRAASPALGELNKALPTVRAFAAEALPGVRSSVPALDAAMPWIRQGRGLVRERELKGLAGDLRAAVPSLVTLNRRLIPTLSELRALSSCTNRVLVPFAQSKIPSIEAGNSGQEVRRQIMRAFTGLSGESRVADANTPIFHVNAVNPLGLATGKIEPGPPPDSTKPPVHRPDVPCETQDPPNMSAPSGPASAFGIPDGSGK